ncbi:MAG: aminotransferase class III-fold pyridoxal phosphate-dependent enzyme [Gammaproteobacteria bacterium]|nr:aminotransferase class III-fold pyridoxal phosphate-dependent enzyme [Gammaproteobacteria bacterium]
MVESGLLERRQRALGPAYRLFYQNPVHIVRGEGVYLFGADGRRYLDCYNNVAAVGHCHPRVVAAISEQAAKLATHTRYLHENVVRYAERLAETFAGELGVCMFANSGSEANELAFRMARAVTGNEGAVVTECAYHGTSNATFAFSTEDYPADDRPPWIATVAAPDLYRNPLGCARAQFSGAYGALIGSAADELAQRGSAAALYIADGVYSTSGILTPPADYLQEAYRQIRAAGGLAVADEVQSGLCRLGDNWWAFQDSAVVPDIVTAGKPLGNGYPLAAVVTTPEIAAQFSKKYHYFNTFGGNPVAAAAGLAVLDVIEDEELKRNVRETGQYLAGGLQTLQREHEIIGDARGKGLFFGLELVRDRHGKEPAKGAAVAVRERLRDDGVLLGVTGPHGNVIKIRPPMAFTRDHADHLINALDEALRCLD